MPLRGTPKDEKWRQAGSPGRLALNEFFHSFSPTGDLVLSKSSIQFLKQQTDKPKITGLA